MSNFANMLYATVPAWIMEKEREDAEKKNENNAVPGENEKEEAVSPLENSITWIVEKEKNLPHKIHSVDEINDLLRRTKWGGPFLTEKFSPQEKEIRKERYEKLHEKLVRAAAKKVLLQKPVAPLIAAGQTERGEPQEKSSKDRYPEDLMFDYSGTDEANKYNAELSQVFIDAKNSGIELSKRENAAKNNKGTKPREKTQREIEREKRFDKLLDRRGEIERKFNEYHEKLFDRIAGYPIDDIIRNSGDDAYLVENFDKINELTNLSAQIENIKTAYRQAKFPIPDKVKQAMEKLMPELSIFENLGMRMDFMDSPYYEEIDMDDPAAQKVFGSQAVSDLVSDTKEFKDSSHPHTNEYDMARACQNMYAYKLHPLNSEMLAAKSMLLEMGVSLDNMVVQCGNERAKPFLAKDTVRAPIAMGKAYDDLEDGRIDHITIFDKSDPTRMIEIPAGLGKNSPVAKAWREGRKRPLPKPVEKPGWFKELIHKKFGWHYFKKDFEDYERYETEVKQRLKDVGLAEKTPEQRRELQQSRLNPKKENKKEPVNQQEVREKENKIDQPKEEIKIDQPKEEIKIEQPKEEIKIEEHEEEIKNKQPKEEQNKEEIKIEEHEEEIKNKQPKEEQNKEEIMIEEHEEEIKIDQPKEEQNKNEAPKEEQNKNEAPKEEQNKEEIKIEEKPKFAPQPEIEDMYYQFSKEENEAMRTWYTSAGAAYENGKFNFVSERNKNIKVPADRKTAIATLGLKGLTYVNNRLKDINIKSATNYMVLTRDMVKAIGVYQMFYDEKGNLKQDEYEKLGKNRKMGDFLSIVEGSTEILTESDLTTKQYAEKLAKKEPIFSKETQNMIMEKYQKKFVKNKPVNADVPAGVPADVPADVSKDPENTVEEKKPSIEEKKPGIEEKKPGMKKTP